MKWNSLQGSVVGPVFKNPKTNWFLNLHAWHFSMSKVYHNVPPIGNPQQVSDVLILTGSPTMHSHASFMSYADFKLHHNFSREKLKSTQLHASIYNMPYCHDLVSVHFYFFRNYQVKNFALSVVHWERCIFMKTRWSSVGEAYARQAIRFQPIYVNVFAVST